MQHIVLYMPAYHRGYADFFSRYPKVKLYLLDQKFVADLFPPIMRDMRAVSARDLATMVSSLGDVKAVDVLNIRTVARIQRLDGEFILPDEDVSHMFADKYLADKKVTFVPIHLRWDGWGSVKETPVPASRTITRDSLHKELIGQARRDAQKSPDWWRQVGAVIAKDGTAVLVGHNRPNASDIYKLNAYGDPRSNFDAGVAYELTTAEHGEAHIIGVAARTGVALEGAEIYVTTFPCPTCAKLIVTAGIKKVYYADGYSLVDAEEVLTNAGIEIILVKEKD